MEDRFEELTKRLQAERESLSQHKDQGLLQGDSDTASMTSITGTDDSFRFHGNDGNVPQSPHYQQDMSYGGYGGHSPDSSKMSSQLLDSCLRELEDRGTLNSGYIRDNNMDYMQEDPYSSHRFAPHTPHDPYYNGGGDGGGGYDMNYANNTSFDGQSNHSIHSDRNRTAKNYNDIPNGGPYGSHNNLRQSQQDILHGSPQPARSLSPQDYPSHGQGDGGYGPRESPYHNLPPYQGGQDYRDDYGDHQNYYAEHEGGRGDPHQGNYLPPNDPQHYHYDDDGLHDDGYRQRDGSYAGSQNSYQGQPGNEPHHSGNYQDPYSQDVPRYNGGVHYPDDSYGQGEQDYGYQGDPNYAQHGNNGGAPIYDPQHQSFHEEPTSFHDDPRYHPDQMGYGPDSSLQEHPRDIQNLSRGPPEDIYNEELSYSQHQPHQNSSFHHLPQDSFQGQPHIDNDPYNQNNGPPSQQYDPYNEQEHYSDAPQEHRSYDHPAGDPYYQEHTPHPNDSFHQSRQDNYLDNSQPRFEGLPPLRADPFADDPFREQNSRDASHLAPREDPYYRGNSPSGGPDPSHYEERVPPFDDRGVPYDDRGPPYDDRVPPYDERDAPDPYSQSAPRYPPGRDFQEEDAARRLEQLNLLGAAPGMIDGRRTPSADQRFGGPPLGSGMPIRYPDLSEVIDFLSHPDDSVKASAAAHMQHITYMDDAVKAKTRSMGGIPALVQLLSHEKVEVHKNACGALQNLSYGKNNNDNKRAIKNEGGIPELIRLLRKSDQENVKESVTGILWNLSSCEDLKQSIIDDGLSVIVTNVILRYSGYSVMGSASTQMPWIAACRNTTGVLRNVSSAGVDARKRLRETRGLVNALIYMLKLASTDETTETIDNKVVENTVCILRNLSYRIQEVVDPDFYKKRTLPRQTTQGKGKNTKGGSDSAGCFGNKSNKAKNAQNKSGSQVNNPPPQLPPSSIEYRSLWGPEIHSLYSCVLKRCTNPTTMEAAAGAIQNLTACDWQPAVESRAMVRKEKGLPLLVDLLSAESDRVVCATATALRNLAIDEKNKELVGKYAIRQLVSRLPRDSRNSLPDDTICAVVATLYEVVKDNQDFAMALVTEDGLPRLMHINSSEGRFLARTLRFTQHLLKTLWGYKLLHSEYAKLSYGQNDFLSQKAYPRQDGARPQDTSRTPTSTLSTPYNTLSRPMSGQGYDDSTMSPGRMQQQRGYYADQRGFTEADAVRAMNRSNASLHDTRDHHNYSRDRIQEDVLLNDLGPGPGYAPLDEPRPHQVKPPTGGVPLFPNLAPVEPSLYGDPHIGGEPVYAQVNKSSRRRPDQYDPNSSMGMQQNMMGRSRDLEISSNHSGGGGVGDAGGGADSWV